MWGCCEDRAEGVVSQLLKSPCIKFTGATNLNCLPANPLPCALHDCTSSTEQHRAWPRDCSHQISNCDHIQVHFQKSWGPGFYTPEPQWQYFLSLCKRTLGYISRIPLFKGSLRGSKIATKSLEKIKKNPVALPSVVMVQFCIMW